MAMQDEVAAGFTAKLGELALSVSLRVTTAIFRRIFLCIVFSRSLSARLTRIFREGMVRLLICLGVCSWCLTL